MTRRKADGPGQTSSERTNVKSRIRESSPTKSSTCLSDAETAASDADGILKHALSPQHALFAMSAIESLSSEMLQMIATDLDLADLKSFRLACKICANAGARYLLRFSYLFLTQERIDRLKMVNQHPLIGPSLKKIVIDPTPYFEKTTTAEWFQGRVGGQLRANWKDYESPTGSSLSDRDKRALKRAEARFSARSEADRDRDEPGQSLRKNGDLLSNRTLIQATLAGCSSVDTIVIVEARGCDVRSHYAEAGKRAARYLQSRHDYRSRQSVPMFEVKGAMLADALRATAMGNFSFLHIYVYRFSGDFGMTFLASDLDRVFLNMRTFAATIAVYEPHGGQDFEALADDAGPGKSLRQGLLQARHLEVFKLSSSRRSLSDLSRILRVVHWTALTACYLSDLTIAENDIVSFLLRHRQTLKRLFLCALDLSQGGLSTFMSRISGQFPSLDSIALRSNGGMRNVAFAFGRFIWAPRRYFALPDPCADRIEFTDCIEAFVLHGSLPVDFDWNKEQPREYRHSANYVGDFEDFEHENFYGW